MSAQQIEEYLRLPHVAVLSVSRNGRGPIAAPIWYEYRGDVVRFVTSRDSVHGRVLQRTGWATLTVRSEHYGEDHTIEQYANVEGPVGFEPGDLRAAVTAIRRRYYTGSRADDWASRPLITTQEIAVLRPVKMAGFIWEESL